jgi:hypothetical protein
MRAGEQTILSSCLWIEPFSSMYRCSTITIGQARKNCSHTLPMTYHYSTDEPHQVEPVIDLPPPPIEDTLAGSLQQRKQQ